MSIFFGLLYLKPTGWFLFVSLRRHEIFEQNGAWLRFALRGFQTATQIANQLDPLGDCRWLLGGGIWDVTVVDLGECYGMPLACLYLYLLGCMHIQLCCIYIYKISLYIYTQLNYMVRNIPYIEKDVTNIDKYLIYRYYCDCWCANSQPISWLDFAKCFGRCSASGLLLDIILVALKGHKFMFIGIHMAVMLGSSHGNLTTLPTPSGPVNLQ